jgi:hypothetical protein
MFGFQAITDIGAALEQAAISIDTDASRKWVGELSRYLDRADLAVHPGGEFSERITSRDV